MKKILYILSLFFVFGCLAQKETSEVSALNNQVGQPLTGNNYEGCDTLTGEKVLYDIINSNVCECYSLDGEDLVKRSCDNVVPGACETKQYIPRNCNEKRSYTLGYDNGVTPGSSTNDCGARVNFIRFSWPMEVVSWEVNGILVGQGYVFPAFSGWMPQLQGWSDFFNQFDPNIANSAFGFNPAPTWRYAELEGCDPNASYGVLTLRRTDTGCEYKVFPVLDSEFKEKIYDYACIVDGKKEVRYCIPDGMEWRDTTGVDSLQCFMPCGYDFSETIQEDAVSPCVQTFIDYACDSIDVATQVQLAIVINDCDGVRSTVLYTLDDYINSTDPEIPEYEIQGVLKNCDGGDFEYPPVKCESYDFELTTVCTIIDGEQCEIFKKIEYCDGTDIITYEDFNGVQLGTKGKDGSITPPELVKCNIINSITDVYQYCHNNKPVIYCIDGKDLTFYQDGVLLESPEFHKCDCPVEDAFVPIGDQTICTSRKLGADFTSNAVGSGTHTLNSLFDTNGPVIDWSGTFTVTDSNGDTHSFFNGQTVTGLSSGSTQGVTFTGWVEWTDGTDTFRCQIDKAISANFTVQ